MQNEENPQSGTLF